MPNPIWTRRANGKTRLYRRSRSSRFRLPARMLLAWLLIAPLLGIPATTGQAAKDGNAYDLIAAVNSLRKANGLPPYEIDGSLMAAAQAHSNYQASIGSITHTGKGGTRPRDRAIAAGYGGGAAVYVTENIAGGGNLTPQGAVQMWQGDSLHLNTMLGGNYTHVGAGSASDGNMTYYTLDVGYIAGQAGNGGTGSTGSAATSIPGKPPATQVAFYPVEMATPLPDGSIIHLVQPGQTLWTIAAIYKVNLPDVLALNDLTNNTFIYPGDKILVKPPSATQAPTQAATATAEIPTPTRIPSRTPTLAATEIAALPPDQAAPAASHGGKSWLSSLPIQDPILLAIAALVLAGTALIIIGNVLKREG